MQQTLQREARIMRLLSLACQSSARATIESSLMEASVLIDNLDPQAPGVSHFIDAAFAINIDLLKGLDNMVTTDFDAIAARITALTGQVHAQQRDVTKAV